MTTPSANLLLSSAVASIVVATHSKRIHRQIDKNGNVEIAVGAQSEVLIIM